MLIISQVSRSKSVCEASKVYQVWAHSCEQDKIGIWAEKTIGAHENREYVSEELQENEQPWREVWLMER